MSRRLSSLLAVAATLVLPATAAAAPAKQAPPQPGPAAATIARLEDKREAVKKLGLV